MLLGHDWRMLASRVGLSSYIEYLESRFEEPTAVVLSVLDGKEANFRGPLWTCWEVFQERILWTNLDNGLNRMLGTNTRWKKWSHSGTWWYVEESRVDVAGDHGHVSLKMVEMLESNGWGDPTVFTISNWQWQQCNLLFFVHAYWYIPFYQRA